MESKDLEELKLQMRSLSLDVREAQGKSSEASKSQPWWITLTQILGIPALLILMFLNFNQSESTVQSTQKTIAETEKIKTEEIKTRVELEKLLSELSDQKTTNLEEYREQIDATLPKLTETINKLNEIEASKRAPLTERLILVFLLLWVVYHGLSLVFSIIEYIWNALVNLAAGSIYKFTNQGSALRRKFLSVMSTIIPVFYPIAGIFRWSIELFVFVALVLPFFDEVILALGSPASGKDVIDQFFNFEFSNAVKALRDIIQAQSS